MRTQTKKILLGMLMVALIGCGAWWAARPTPVKSTAGVAVPVRVVQVARQDVPHYVSGIGAVLSLHSVMIRPQIDGILTQLLVKEGQTVKAGDLLATLDDRSIQASLDQAKQTLDQQQALVNQLKATAQGNQASIAAAQVQLSYTRIHSPVSGRVGIRAVDPGNFLRVSDTQGLFSVTQIDPIAVEFSLPQQLLPTLHKLLGAKDPALVKAFLGDSSHSGTALGEGRLSLIDNQVSASTGTIKVKARFDNPDHNLWPGQLVNVEIQTGVSQNALVVPPQVVQRGLDNYFVYRIVGDKVETVPVQMLYQDSGLNIISGVNPGDTLVSDGQSRLKPGSRVEVLSEPALTSAQAVQP